MPPRNNHRGERGRGGSPGKNLYRGRGSGRGGRGRGRGRGAPPDLSNEIDFVIQRWPGNEQPGFAPPRSYIYGGSRGRAPEPPSSASVPSRGRGMPSRERARGNNNLGNETQRRPSRGIGKTLETPIRKTDQTLSKLLYAERPLLKPVVFVRSKFTTILFQENDDIFKPIVETAGDDETSHLPTADRVRKIFMGSGTLGGSPSNGNSDTDQLEEIDFEDMGKIRTEVELLASTLTGQTPMASLAVQESFTGVIHRIKPTSDLDDSRDSVLDSPLPEARPTPNDEIGVELGRNSNLDLNFGSQTNKSVGFFVDTTPSTVSVESSAYSQTYRVESNKIEPLGVRSLSDDDEVIVYVAPHPRMGRNPSVSNTPLQSPNPPSASIQPEINSMVGPSAGTIPSALGFDSVSFSFSNSPKPVRQQPRHPPAVTTRGKLKNTLKAHRKEARVARRLAKKKATFGSFGDLFEDVQMWGKEGDPSLRDRRRNDSDLEWGDEDNDSRASVADPLENISSGLGEMDLDPELDINHKPLLALLKGLGPSGSQFVTMDDIADEARMREEDEESDADRGSSDDDGNSGLDKEVDDILHLEENLMVSEPRNFSLDKDDNLTEGDSSSEDDDADPGSGFQARLERLRKQAEGKRAANGDRDSSFDRLSDEDEYFSKADKDEALIDQINDILDENESILHSRNRKSRNNFFSAIHNGSFDDTEELMSSKRKNRPDPSLPSDLRLQWEKDRTKKAENKRARAEARLMAAADPFASHKGGKKGRKAMLAAARLDPSVSLPNRIVDFATLERQIRAFIANIGGPASISLPPMEKAARKKVHTIANAFNLRSISKGFGNHRYTTLTKTTKTGLVVDEKRVRGALRRSNPFSGPGGSKNPTRTKEGDIVGELAPKIGESNVGFRLLASMGWSEGDRIGVSGGLEAPLTAIMKSSKLGLGASSGRFAAKD